MDQITESSREKESGLESVPARLGVEEEGRQTDIAAVREADGGFEHVGLFGHSIIPNMMLCTSY